MKAANDEGPLPWEVAEMRLCERFGCLPSQLDGEDWGRMMASISLTYDYDTVRKHMRGEKLTAREDALVGELYQFEVDAWSTKQK